MGGSIASFAILGSAPARAPALASRQNSFCKEVRDREDLIANTQDAGATQIRKIPLSAGVQNVFDTADRNDHPVRPVI